MGNIKIIHNVRSNLVKDNVYKIKKLLPIFLIIIVMLGILNFSKMVLTELASIQKNNAVAQLGQGGGAPPDVGQQTVADILDYPDKLYGKSVVVTSTFRSRLDDRIFRIGISEDNDGLLVISSKPLVDKNKKYMLHDKDMLIVTGVVQKLDKKTIKALDSKATFLNDPASWEGKPVVIASSVRILQ